MDIDIISIFPDFFKSVFSHGVVSKAIENSLINVNTHDLRKYSENKHLKVDDTPYGGGSGMVMTPEPIGNAIDDIRDKKKKSIVVLTTPQGKKLDDSTARELSEYEQIIILCGRYEGIDERINELYVDMEISTGEYINSGGEYAASIITDAVSRHIPGVLGNSESADLESFTGSLLEYPQYTKPNNYKGLNVPEILISGNHAKIDEWRKNQSIKRTFDKNPDLLDHSNLTEKESEYLKNYILKNSPQYKVYIALIHYPVYNKQLKIISTACKSIDIHDISRDSATFGVEKFFVVTPVDEQQKLVRRLIDHWTIGAGIKFNDTKHEAFQKVEIKNSLDDVISEIESKERKKPELVYTDARITNKMVGYNFLRKKIFENKNPFLILFGTGWGLAKEITDKSDYILKPVSGFTDYNHLSVRSAVAIILDRLLSCKI